MASIKFKLNDVTADFRREMPKLVIPIQKAATKAMRQAANLTQLEGRDDISGALSKRAAQAFKVEAYPKKDYSVDAAAMAKWKWEAAEIHDEGGTIKPIKGKYLWLPLSGAFGGRKAGIAPSDIGVR